VSKLDFETEFDEPLSFLSLNCWRMSESLSELENVEKEEMGVSDFESGW